MASLRRYVAANLPEEARRSQVTMLRLVPAEAGQEAQIDYGQLGRWLDPGTGRLYAVNAFAMVLCCSRHMFVRPVISMDQQPGPSATWPRSGSSAVAGRGVPEYVPRNIFGLLCPARLCDAQQLASSGSARRLSWWSVPAT